MKVTTPFRSVLPLLLLLLHKIYANELPNIIFAMADDLGWGDVQYNGGNALTPNIDEMSQSPNTMLLQRYYSGGPRCSPTRGTVLTGRNHNRYCVWSTSGGSNAPDFKVPEPLALPLTEITVAEVVREFGYSTAMFGKWHLGDFVPIPGGNKKWPVSHPGLHGFDQWWATERSTATCTPNCGCFNSTCMYGHYPARGRACMNYHTNKSDDILGWPDPVPGDDSDFLWNLSETYIREQVKSSQPFFLYLPFHTVHSRFIATEYYRQMYLKKNYSSEEADYYGAISALDVVIGRLRDLLKELGIRDNTMFWFTSDNGPAKLTPGVTNGLRGRKSSLFEGGVRVPGMIEWPAVISTNQVSQYAVVSSDLLPTVYDILGTKPRDDRPLDGISILPFLHGTVKSRNQTISWAFEISGGNFDGHYNVTIAGDRYKLMVVYGEGEVHSLELYDLVEDLGETKDIAQDHPEITSQLLTEAEQWRSSVIGSVHKVGCLNSD